MNKKKDLLFQFISGILFVAYLILLFSFQMGDSAIMWVTAVFMFIYFLTTYLFYVKGEGKTAPSALDQARNRYEAALVFKMHGLFRVFGVLLGLLLVFGPVWMTVDAYIKTNGAIREYFKVEHLSVLFFVFFIGTLSGAMFLFYSIPKKTPDWVLRKLRKNIEVLESKRENG